MAMMSQDLTEIFELLGTDPGKISIYRINVNTWGADVVIECQYEEGRTFQLLFEECKSIQWDMYATPDAQDKTADIVGILLGAGNYQASAIIYTDLFELSILYGDFALI
jgi:hypothetical protein